MLMSFFRNDSLSGAMTSPYGNNHSFRFFAGILQVVRRFRRISLNGAIFAASVVPLYATAGPQHYEVYDFEANLALRTDLTLYAINDHGQVAGESFWHGAFVWSQATGYRSLQIEPLHDWMACREGACYTTQSQYTVPLKINDSGMVAGYTFYPFGGVRAVAGASDALMYDVLGPSIPTGSIAQAINDQGVVAGTFDFPDAETTEQHVFLARPHGIVVDIGSPSGMQGLAVAGMSDGNRVLVNAMDSSGRIRAFVWNQNGWQELPGPNSDDIAFPVDMNRLGSALVMAYSFDYIYGLGGTPTAYVVTEGGDLLIVPPLENGSGFMPTALNDAGTVVGTALGTPAEGGAFIWHPGESNVELLNDLIDADLGIELDEAVDINNAGQIIARGYRGNQFHHFLLTPISEVSEPAISLLIAAIAMCGCLGRSLRPGVRLTG